MLEYSDELKEVADHWSGKPGAPNEFSRSRWDGIPFYRNRVVENIFARVHPITPLIWFVPVAAYGLYRGFAVLHPAAVVGLFVAGWLVWTLTEYLLHRFVFHLTAVERKLPFFIVHGYHHEFPHDGMRLVAPFFASWSGAAIFFVLYLLILGSEMAWPLIAGTGAGYAAYDSIHYYIHHAKPRSRIWRWMKVYHYQHHFQNPDAHFGISNPLWDFVFRTTGSARAKSGPKASEAPVE
jgi:hypothetical protein